MKSTKNHSEADDDWNSPGMTAECPNNDRHPQRHRHPANCSSGQHCRTSESVTQIATEDLREDEPPKERRQHPSLLNSNERMHTLKKHVYMDGLTMSVFDQFKWRAISGRHRGIVCLQANNPTQPQRRAVNHCCFSRLRIVYIQ